MKTVGDYLKEARIKRKLSQSELERVTKIKNKFIDSIEKGDWKNLPEFPIVSGFVRAISRKLGLPEENALALLRRDYPISKNGIIQNPKPDLKLYFSISPKFTIFAVTALFILFISGYLGFQYFQYISPPKLEVEKPADGDVVYLKAQILGKTDSDATLSVNNQSVLVSSDGTFSDTIEVGEETKEIVFVAKSRYGKETVVVRNVVPKQK